MSDDKFIKFDEKLDQIVNSIHQLGKGQNELSQRLNCLESQRLESAHLDDFDDGHTQQRRPVLVHAQAARDTVGPTVGGATGSAADIQRDFEVLKDSLVKVKLPNELRVFDSKQGIKAESQTALNILSKSARYTETALKWFSTHTKDGAIGGDGVRLSEDDLQQLFLILSAEINFLQGEYAGLVVKSTFDETTSKFFKTLEKNTTSFSEQALTNLLV